MKDKTKIGLSIGCTISAIVIGFIALFLPPSGVIDSSVLWFTSQLLLFVASMLGINMSFGKYGSTTTNTEKNKP